MKRWTLRILLCLILGAITTVAAAWVCARWWDVRIDESVLQTNATSWKSPVPNDWPTSPQWLWMASGPCIEEWIVEAHRPPERDEFNPTLYRLVTHNVGWPALAMQWHLHGVMENARGSIDWFPSVSLIDHPWIAGLNMEPPYKMSEDIVFAYRRFPLQPIWTGFVIDTLFYAAIWGAVFFGFTSAKRFIRSKRGRCPRCGYDLRGQLDAGCPECGWRREQP